jgi:redox-sensitive bicupin YhaK (pirin superfamily)
MVTMSLQILNREEIPLGGFAGLKEHRLIVDKRIGGSNDTWDGLGNFIYLADAQFLPKGETKLHSHKEIDVISIMIDGCVLHEGSLENGKSMHANQVQAQRAGGEGFEHNEINPE